MMKQLLPAPRITGFLLAAIFVISSVLSCTVQKSPVTGNKRAYGYSWEEELRIGKEADQSIQQQYGIYQDSAVVKYVRRVEQGTLLKFPVQ